jgi:hypothetical protein
MVDTLNAMMAEGAADFVFFHRPGSTEGVKFVVGHREVQSFRDQSRSAEGGSDRRRKRVRNRGGKVSG